MSRRFRVLSAALVAAALAVTSACSSGDDDASASSSGGGKTDKVTYVTAFGAVGRDSFVWLGKEKGFFKEAGIDIDIQKGAGNVQNLTAIKSGQAQFAALDFTGAVIQAGTGAFKDWKAVAAIHQQTLVAIMTTKDTGINAPSDLTGKTVAAGDKSVSQLLFPAYAKLAGIDPKSVTIKGVQTTALNGLMAKRQVDALSTFLLSKTALETASKKEVTVLPYSQYLSDLYGNAIIAKPSLISGNPDLVKRFVGAAMKSLQYTIDHPDEAAAAMNKAEPTAAIPAALGEINAMKPYTTAPGGGALGSMDEQRVAKSIAVLTGAGLMPAGLTPEDVVDFSYTPKA
ncbi:ABC transporter substrate-binding protein [Actinoplanes sp. N902-109]|uniref:ABC transporter substrate-binding protein n=1 Tax=Actinoplanes sp. (strain N902-109) TaxID=649831 RepID=UPI000329648E|nr:ABC transporter substrate-binding protein [Actinoplanes sp. N902-109]AGL17765.1 membrane lipoprotein lipid attachment site [Actinoplanes sp. N902-109]